MFRRFAVVLAFFAVIGIALPDIAPFSANPAQAQTQKKRKNLLELLFGGAVRKQRQLRKQKSSAPVAKRVKVPKSKKKRSKKRIEASANTQKTAKRRTSKRKKVAAAPAVVAVEKNEDAAKVLVIGDFMADGLADGLTRLFAENPAIVIENASVGLSGIVRQDVYDWPESVTELVEKNKPVAVVALVGMNDRQEMRIETGRVQKLTEPWKLNYQTRVDTLVRNIRDARVPLIWVGLPPVSKNSMNADYLVFNETFRTNVEKYGGTFVDVWDGFVDDQGRYVRSGPNVDGQIVALRRADGINMTRSGKIKLGFYAEKAVKRLTGLGKDALFSSLNSLSENGTQTPQYDPVSTGETIVVALGSPAVDGGSELEGVEGFATANDASYSSSFDLVTKGQSASVQTGRVDAGWGRSAFELGQGETPEPVLANMRGTSYRSLFEDPETGKGSQPEAGSDVTRPQVSN